MALFGATITLNMAAGFGQAPPKPQNPNTPYTGASKSLSQGAKADPVTDPARELEPSLKQFIDALSIVQSQAAETPSADKMIYEGAIPAMLRQLDPHSQFFDPGQFDQLKHMEESEQKGFGSIVSVMAGQVIFLQTLPGTPSNKAGIQAGDRLVGINNVAIAPLQPEQIISLLTEARQQQVTLYVRREGSARVLPFTVSPALVDAPSVDRAYLLKPGYGYIRVASWDLQTGRQLRAAIEKLGGGKLKGLVLDLRNNPGGVVKAALEGASLFLKPGQRILTARSRAAETETADVPPNAKPYEFGLAVILNDRTASASEILSGALQDHDRALVIGEPSYGKGLVQSVMPLSGGAGLALTTAFYYTPSGRSIQRPIRNSALSSTFSGTESRPVFKTDGGRTVLGGGGIAPDIDVLPSVPTRFEGFLDAHGVFVAFATAYLNTHKDVGDDFQVTPSILDDFHAYLAERNVQPSMNEWTTERTWITSRLKEEIVIQAKGVDKGDEVQAQRDPQVLEALRAVESNQLAQPKR